MATLGLRLIRSPAAAAGAQLRQLSHAASHQKTEAPLDWQKYFALKRSRRMWQRAGTALFGLGAFSLGSFYFVCIAEFDPTKSLLGMPDPTIEYVLGAIASAGAGALAGSIASSHVWRAARSSSVLRGFDMREKDFFKRIAKHRPKELPIFTPTRSAATPPDYYGENIFSPADYRQWIRRQKRFVAATIGKS